LTGTKAGPGVLGRLSASKYDDLPIENEKVGIASFDTGKNVLPRLKLFDRR